MLHVCINMIFLMPWSTQRENQLQYTWLYNLNLFLQVPGFRDWFNITYDGDEAIYTYHRLDSDLESADLEIIV
jgi:hypothetical protein